MGKTQVVENRTRVQCNSSELHECRHVRWCTICVCMRCDSLSLSLSLFSVTAYERHCDDAESRFSRPCDIDRRQRKQVFIIIFSGRSTDNAMPLTYRWIDIPYGTPCHARELRNELRIFLREFRGHGGSQLAAFVVNDQNPLHALVRGNPLKCRLDVRL